jgi:hypothetical protein
MTLTQAGSRLYMSPRAKRQSVKRFSSRVIECGIGQKVKLRGQIQDHFY